MIKQLVNSSLLDQDWSDETVSKNILKKGILNLDWEKDGPYWVLKSGSSFDIDGVVCQLDADENFILSKDDTVYIVNRNVGVTTSSVDYSDGFLTVTTEQIGDSSQPEITSIVFPAITTSSSYDSGIGFMYHSGTSPVSFWISNCLPNWTPPDDPEFTAVWYPDREPSWVDGKQVVFQVALGYDQFSAEEFGRAASNLLANRSTTPEINISQDDEVLTITSTVNRTNTAWEDHTSGLFDLTVIQEGTSSLPHIVELECSGYTWSDHIEDDWDGKGIVAYIGDLPVSIWFLCARLPGSDGYRQITDYSEDNPPSWVTGTNFPVKIYIDEYSGNDITAISMASQMKRYLMNLSSNSEFEAGQNKKIVACDGSDFTYEDTLPDYDKKKKGYYDTGTNKRYLSLYDDEKIYILGDEPLYFGGKVIVKSNLASPIIKTSYLTANSAVLPSLSVQVSKTAQDSKINCACFSGWGTATWVVGGSSGASTHFQSSANFVDWTTRTNPDTGSSASPNSIDYYPYLGLFIATSRNKLITSSDGATWTTRDPSLASYLYATDWNRQYTGGVYIAVGNNVCAASSNGTSWTAGSIATGYYSYTVWDGRQFIVQNQGTSTILTSTTGLTWTSTDTGFTFNKMAYGNGMYLFTGHDGIYKSTDLTTFTKVGDLLGNYLIYCGGMFLATGADQSKDLYKSLDGINWVKTRIFHETALHFIKTIGDPEKSFTFMAGHTQTGSGLLFQVQVI